MWGGWKWKVRLGVWIDEGKFVGFVCVLVCVWGGECNRRLCSLGGLNIIVQLRV